MKFDISEVLSGGDRPRMLSPSEEERILNVLHRAERESGGAPDPDRVIDLTAQHKPRVHHSARRRRIWSAAMAAAAVVTLIVGLSVNRDEPMPAASNPNTTASSESPPSQTLPGAVLTTVQITEFCDNEFTALISVLEQWDGVENWAWINGSPSVAEALRAALVGLQAYPQTTNAAAAAIERLDEGFEQIDGFPGSDREPITANIVAVNQGLDDLMNIIMVVNEDFVAGNGVACNVENLESVR